MNRQQRRAAERAGRGRRHPVDSEEWLSRVLSDPRTDSDFARAAVIMAAAASDERSNIVVTDGGAMLSPSKWDGRNGRIFHLSAVA